MFGCNSTKNASDSNKMDNTSEETIGIERESNNGGVAADTPSTVRQVVPTAKEAIQALEGSWQWIKTECCGRMMSEIFPKEDEDARIISFDLKGNARYFTDETKEKVSEVPYELDKLGPTQPTIRMGELQPAIFTVKNDTLILSWGYMDLQIEYYVRPKGE